MFPRSRHGVRLFSSVQLFAVLISCSPARADSPDLRQDAVSLPPLIVTATRIPTPQDEVASSVSVITAADIALRQRRTLPDVLQDVPGLNLVQTGGPGGAASIFTRGTNANQTKVLIDGIDVADPSSPNGGVDFSQILASDIDRIEVLRGPQSGLYGSDAIGGVINIITKRGSGPPRFQASIEGGSFGTVNQTAGLSGSSTRFTYSVDLAHFRSDGTNVTPANLVPKGRSLNSDGNDNKTLATKFGFDLTDEIDIGLVARYTDTALRSTNDDFLGPETKPSASNNRELFTRATAHVALFEGAFEQTFGIAYTDYRRRFFDPNNFQAEPSFFRGNRIKIDWQGNIKASPDETITIGAEHEVNKIDDSSPVRAENTNNAGFIQLQSNIGQQFFNTISVRYDDNERFGSKTTYRLAPAFLIPSVNMKLKASLGTGFKAPSLDQLFDNFPQFNFFANPNLKPETSTGYDLGIEQSFLNKTIFFGTTYFHNNIKNLITTNNTFTSYTNLGKITTQGIETTLSYKPTEDINFRLDYTYLEARDDHLQMDLLRRPKNKTSFNIDWKTSQNATLAASILHVGSSADINRSGTVSGLTAPGYTLLNVAGSYEFNHGLTAFARVDNLLDQKFQSPIGFLHQGLGIFTGLRIAFDTNRQIP